MRREEERRGEKVGVMIMIIKKRDESEGWRWIEIGNCEALNWS